MNKHILFFVFLFGVVSGLFAQDSIQFSLKPGMQEKKEIQVLQLNSDGLTDFKLFLNVEWKNVAGKDQVSLTFDRTNSDGEGLLLCFPLIEEPTSPNKLKSCNSISNRIWKGKGAKSIQKIGYFFQSDDVEKEYNDCYRFVAINNKEDFEFNVVEGKDLIHLSLNNLFVMREEKRAWHTFSKRDIKLEYRAEPINIQITLNRACQQESNIQIMKDINEKVVDLEALKVRAEEAINTANCHSQLKRIHSELRVNYPLEIQEWNDSDCEEAQVVLSRYKELVVEIESMECKASVKTSGCPDLKKINNRLMNLQMQIYAKKKDGKNIDREKKEFLNIKNDTDKKITADCNKDLLNAYRSFCTYIEEALGN
ncbi:MAG: hypothetical protein ACK5M3_13050 [Dysgonomonas sp.]